MALLIHRCNSAGEGRGGGHHPHGPRARPAAPLHALRLLTVRCVSLGLSAALRIGNRTALTYIRRSGYCRLRHGLRFLPYRPSRPAGEPLCRYVMSRRQASIRSNPSRSHIHFARKTGQIVEQLLLARKHLQSVGDDTPILRIVFMGMGEPFDNYDAVTRALAVLTEQSGKMLLGPRKATVSVRVYVHRNLPAYISCKSQLFPSSSVPRR